MASSSALTGISGLQALFLALGLGIGLAFLGLWAVYTVIWRAVRRGIREANQPQMTPSVPVHLRAVSADEASGTYTDVSRVSRRRDAQPAGLLRAMPGPRNW